jgi:hypothetical protein
MEQETNLGAVLDVMTEHEVRLRRLLEAFDRKTLATRPPSGDWSAIENIRHALHAEQHHLGRFVPGGLGVSPLRLPQGVHPPVTGNDPRTDPKVVFDEWERIHAAARERLDLTLPGLAVQLPRLMRHQQAHGRLAARALSEITGNPVRLPHGTGPR